MREGTTKLLAACKREAQTLEAAKNLLTSDARVLAYMAELQKRKTEEYSCKRSTENGGKGASTPCKGKVSVSGMVYCFKNNQRGIFLTIPRFSPSLTPSAYC